MARTRSEAGWYALSEKYRNRLTRAGISKNDYLAGAKLQSARGQSRAEPTRRARVIQAIARKLGLGTSISLPSASTYQKWKNRFIARGGTADDWDRALRTSSDWQAVIDSVRWKEKGYRTWVNAGKPWGGNLIDRITATHGIAPPFSWGPSWGFYH